MNKYELSYSVVLPRVYQRVNVDLKKPTRLYQPFLVPEKPWEIIHIDFVIDLPIDQNCTIVLTIVDSFLKMCIFVPLSSITAEHVNRGFFQNIIPRYELLSHIISDRDPKFTGKFWRELMRKMKIELQFSTAFHPQADGLAEVNNQMLE